MNDLSIGQLIEASLQNNTRAFRELVGQHQQMVYSVAFRLLANEEEARDVVQDTFVKVWQNLSIYQQEKKFSTWLYTITTNLCLDKLRSGRCQCSSPLSFELDELVSGEHADRKLLDSEMGEVIVLLTNELTPKQKVVFTLRCLEELELDEIERITGLSQAKIKSNLYLARQAMRKSLDKYYNSYAKK